MHVVYGAGCPKYSASGIMSKCNILAHRCFGVVVRVILHLRACVWHGKGRLYTLLKYAALGGGVNVQDKLRMHHQIGPYRFLNLL